MVVTEIEPTAVDYERYRHLFTALVPHRQLDAVLRPPGGIGHNVIASGPHPRRLPRKVALRAALLDRRGRGGSRRARAAKLVGSGGGLSLRIPIVVNPRLRFQPRFHKSGPGRGEVIFSVPEWLEDFVSGVLTDFEAEFR